MSRKVKRPQCINCKGKEFERIYGEESDAIEIEYVNPEEYLRTEDEPQPIEKIVGVRVIWLICKGCGTRYKYKFMG